MPPFTLAGTPAATMTVVGSVLLASALGGCGGDVFIDGAGGGDADAEPTNDGTVAALVDEPGFLPPGVRTSISAHFYEDGPRLAPLERGVCAVSRPADYDHATSVGVGTVSILGAHKPITLAEGSGNFAGDYDFDDATIAWSPGAELRVIGSGSPHAPAFSVPVVAPDHLVMLEPPGVPVGGGVTLPVDASAGLEVRWKPFSHGDLHLVVSGWEPKHPNAIGRNIECLFDGSAGVAKVGGAFLTKLALGTVSLGVSAISLSSRRFGSWGVEALLDLGPRTASGEPYVAPSLDLE